MTAADDWFVVSDQVSPAAVSGDPSVMVSWKFSNGIPAPTFPVVPSAGMDSFAMDFGSINLASGQTVTVTIRRELFDSASLALLNGLPVNLVGIITQTLGDTSKSNWGALFGGSPNFMNEADLTTPANGLSADAFDAVGQLTLSPSVTLPGLIAQNSAGPLVSASSSGPVTATHRFSLVSGRHATDEDIILTNTSGSAQNVSLRIDDNYGSDSSTRVHGTSSGDTTVTTADMHSPIFQARERSCWTTMGTPLPAFP